MDVSYRIIHGPFEMEAASMESELATKATTELERLTRIGFGETQMALDLAIEARSRLKKCCLLLLRTGMPGATETVNRGRKTIRELDELILNIKHARGEA